MAGAQVAIATIATTNPIIQTQETNMTTFKDTLNQVARLEIEPWGLIGFFVLPHLFTIQDYYSYATFFFILIYSFQKRFLIPSARWVTYIFRTMTILLFVSFVLHMDYGKYYPFNF